jgi:DNA mismatch repair protein MutL
VAAAAGRQRELELHEAGAVLATLPAAAHPAPNGLLRPLGQIQEGYLVAEGPQGLVLIDQHAAHERILLNRFRGLLDQRPGSSQPMLLPQTIQASSGQMAALADHREELAALGFDLEEFGPSTIRILAVPVESGGRAAQALSEMLAVLAEGRRDDSLERALVSLACHSAVRFGDPLEPAEQRRLLEDLEAAGETGLTCPHGRPTQLLIGWQDLKRHFRRNY